MLRIDDIHAFGVIILAHRAGRLPATRLLRKLSQVLSRHRRVSRAIACAGSALPARTLGDTV